MLLVQQVVILGGVEGSFGRIEMDILGDRARLVRRRHGSREMGS